MAEIVGTMPDTQVTVTDESCHFGDLTEPADEMGTDSGRLSILRYLFPVKGTVSRSSAVKSSIQ